MRQNELHYDAFISYRHSELDMFVAKTLHKELEAFRLPKNIVKKMGWDNVPKTRISRVFRDQDELPISSDLKEPIVYALRNSDFLIVICTPRLSESLWCRTEIEQFIDMHGHDRVLAVLAEGEPQESFPEQLCYVMDNGQKKQIEPLAADVRGNSHREIRKKIKNETIRLAAPIFGCGYDDLRQRHRERRLKRIMAISTAAAAICFVFGAVSAAMTMRIQSQAVQIESQKQEIENQYTKALETNAKMQADESLRILEAGDRIKAIKSALEVLPGPQNPKLPYTPQAQYALTQSLGVYEDGTNVLPRYILKHEAPVDFIKLSPDRKLILTADRYGKLYVWDALAGTVIYENEELTKINLSENTAGFLDENRIFFPSGYGIGVYDLSLKEIVFQDEEQSYYSASVSGDGSHYALRGNGELIVYDSASYEPVYGCDMPEDSSSWESFMAFDERGDKIAFTWMPEQDSSVVILAVLNQEGATSIVEFPKADLEVGQFFLPSENELLVSANTLDYSDRKSKIMCLDISEEPTLSWNYEGKLTDSFIPTETMDGERILLNRLDSVVILDADTGEELGQAAAGGTVIQVEPDSGGYYAGLRMQNGEYHLLSYADMRTANMSGDYNFKAVPDNLSVSISGQDFMVSLAWDSSDIIVHAVASGNRMNRLHETDSYIKDILASADEGIVLLNTSSGITAMKPDTGEVIWNYDTEEPVMAAACMAGKGEQKEVAVALPYGMLILDAVSGEVKKELTLDNLDLTMIQFSKDGTRFAIASPWDISVYDTASGNLLIQDGHLEELGNSGTYGLSEDLLICAAACPDEHALKLFDIGGNTTVSEMNSISLNAACVKNIALCSAADRIYVTYLDGRVEVYLISNGSLIKEYTDLPFELKKVDFIDGEEKNILLSGTDTACVVDEGGEPLALLTGPCVAFPQRGVYLAASQGALLSYPIYDVPMLCEDAEREIVNR